MTYDIRPLSFGEILDRAFRVYLDNFALLFGTAAVVWLPSGIILAAAVLIGTAAAVIVNAIFLSIAGLIVTAALNLAVASVYLDRPISIADAYRDVRPIILPLVGTYMLLALFFIVPGALVGGLFLVARPLGVLGLIAFVFIAFYFMVTLLLTTPIIVVERHSGMTALRRSRELVRGAWWQTLGIVVVAGLIAQVPASALKFVWGFIPVIGVILTALTQALSSTYSAVAIMIYYFDRRCRVEDFDLRLLAEQVRSQTAPAPAPAPGSSSLA